MEHLIVFITLILALILFIWDRFRHDIVAVICLLVLVMVGIIPAGEAFSGFSHPAVITVAAVLIVSSGLQKAGIIDVIGKWVMKTGDNLTVQIGVLTVLVCIASAFMNNVGALAILMPVAIHIARKKGYSPSITLMPLAFGSLLGGMMTLIGTPPNIIIATFRAEQMGQPFGMFDFTPVGAGIALAGIVFIILIGWRLLPSRHGESSAEERFHIQDYITEVLITERSTIKDVQIGDLNEIVEADIRVLGLIRDNRRIHAPRWRELLRENDILILEADSDDLKAFIDQTKTELVGEEQLQVEEAGSEDISIVEVVVMPNSPIINKTASRMRMRSSYGVNLLAIARKDRQIMQRIDHVRFNAGDVLLLQGQADMLNETIITMGCLPLADRGFCIGQPKKIALALGVFGLSIAAVVAGFLQVQIAFTLAAVLMVLTGVLPVRDIYTSVDWPVIVLLGAMLPVGAALETTGGAEMIASQILMAGNTLPLWATLSVLIVVTMLLSGVINNAATVVLMAPISVGVAHGLNASVDPFLMTIAIGASCAFLTPIGHQSNTLVMGPGGYNFTDYVKLGLPLSILIVMVAVPLILYFWPA
ncbi:MAG: SLC13 family permease [Methanolobus sp.]|uniref:SLC13 family permease n=1 Tax=Methanolobus sp. TaxID=1874737 RepID=UPI00272FCDFF|nr:SLC13 family permease [Methanolobus sp.]MDP2218403.1 SLC13 family permease [Methanolobus sp.]